MIYTTVLAPGASARRRPLDALDCPEDDSPSQHDV
jgi:hypothetical protein